ncbi:RmlC-like cupin domain-containing protein [Podospora appendiculata]|uniref:RmlC-like cupin domain-containing protein n=1 Tax=Podospora appendiculata TaxID=314037 RepID=A0AAE0X9E5_9PEZI|nr:RmlC-like cupin domain-containing protein [Podospora appendiculata]
MQFTSAIAFAILAYTHAVMATPVPTSTAVAPPPAPTTLSLTQQLFLSDTAVDRFKLLPDNGDFVFSFNQDQKGAGKGGRLIAANRKTFPALVGSGSGMAVGFVGACGMNTLHVHPRGTELQVVVQGRLVTEMAPENGVNNADGTPRVISNTVNAFEMTPFYQGSVHVQFNPDCTDAVFVSSFNSEDFGAGQIANETFAFGNDVVAATFGQSINGADIDKIRAAIPASIALGVEECLMKCNIKKN